MSAATVFGQNLKLEPLKPQKKAMWSREMKCLLSVCDYIVEFAPTAQYLDGTIIEVKFFSNHSYEVCLVLVWNTCLYLFVSCNDSQMMTSRPRSDIYINLPALQKLDTMLIVSQTSIASCT